VGIPQVLTPSQAKEFLAGYAIWTYDNRIPYGPWT
jgi:hypothetical protein